MNTSNKKHEDQWYWLDQEDENIRGPVGLLELHGELLFEKNSSKIKDIFVWCKGMESWTALSECTVLANLVKDLKRDWSTIETPPQFLRKKIPTPIVRLTTKEEASPLRLDLHEDSEDPSFKIQIFKKEEEKPKVERRQHARKKLKLKVLLTNSKNTFLTFTYDISQTGLKLETPVPQDFIGEGIHVLIEDSRTKKRLKLKCQGIIEKDNFERMFFVDLTSEQKEILKKFIEGVESETPSKKLQAN